MTNLIGKKLVLEELKGALAEQFSSTHNLDDKLKLFLSSASFILSLVAALQITAGVEKIGWL